MRTSIVVLLLTAISGAPAQEPLTADEFARLFSAVVVDRPEPWRQIPWRTDLLLARAEASVSRRPLFLWSMNGHPLGCT